jgi:FkbM family methyltransferase
MIDASSTIRIKTALKKSIPQKYHRSLSSFLAAMRGYRTESYSQCGEDFALRWLFHNVANGFYVDIGAFHPKRFSNTYYFYKQGWSGINVDPTPGVIELFRKVRPKDINLACAVARTSGEMKLYVNANDGEVNTLSPSFSAIQEQWGRSYSSEIVVKTRTLAEILDTYKPNDRRVDFLSVDVEGLDLDVLESNNWEKYQPSVILSEDISLDNYECLEESEMWRFLHAKGYRLVAKCVHTLVFVHTSYSSFV